MGFVWNSGHLADDGTDTDCGFAACSGTLAWHWHADERHPKAENIGSVDAGEAASESKVDDAQSEAITGSVSRETRDELKRSRKKSRKTRKWIGRKGNSSH